MIEHILMIAPVLAFMFMIGYGAGHMHMSKKIKSWFGSDNQIDGMRSECNIVDAVWGEGAIAYLIIMFAVCAFGFISTYGSLRHNFIDQYRNGEVVESVTYEYNVIDGQKVPTDSTFKYTRVR